MWDFKIGTTIKLMMKTLPFIIFRMLIYIGIAVLIIASIVIGAFIGSFISSGPEDNLALFGALLGGGLVSGFLYWVREYILYIVKAGHIAVLVELFEGRTLPKGKGQITYAKDKVVERFIESSLLFGLDRLIKGILKAINSAFFTITSIIPIPGAGFINTIINNSMTYIDEIIIAHNFKVKSENPWSTSKDSLILYAQNYKVMLKNAFFITLMMYGISALIFILLVGIIGTIAYSFVQIKFIGIIITLILVWGFKNAVLEPFAIISLMQVYFITTKDQQPNPEWDAKITSMTPHFKKLKDKAMNFVSKKAPATMPPQEGVSDTMPPQGSAPTAIPEQEQASVVTPIQEQAPVATPTQEQIKESNQRENI